MMQRSLSSELESKIGEKVLVKGWLHNLRKLGKIVFVVLRDRGGLAQVVVDKPELIEMVKALKEGSVLQVTGIAQSMQSGAEVVAEQIVVEQTVSEAMPIDISKNELAAHIDTILDYRPLSLRHLKYQAIFKVQGTIVRAYREFLTSQGFTEFFGPSMIGASSEGGTELFNVEYFDNQVKLSQSAQLYKQMMVGVYERVFALMKCFRAEPSATRRHLTEATQFEFEMGFIDGFEDVMDMLERVIKHIVRTVETDCAKEIALLGANLPQIPNDVSIPRIKFRDALQIAFERTGVDERHENDLSPQAEKALCEYAREKHGTDFVFVTNFLRSKTAFYAHPNEQDPTVTNYFDLLCREIEIVSGGQRIHEHDMLVESLKLKGLDPKDFGDYLSIFKYGMPKHGGFGMGMERLTMMLLGLDNIRDACLFPSDLKRIAGVKLAPKIYAGRELEAQIIKKLNAAKVEFKLIEHGETATSEESARERGTNLSDGVKAIILRNKKDGSNVMACVSADQKLDIKKIEGLEMAKFEFEKPEQIIAKYGLKMGSVPPFGNLMGMKVYLAENITTNDRVAFNAASLTKSIIMKGSELAKLVEGIVV